MSKLTHKEHAARAMLMGRVYDWRDGTYCDEEMDADTMVDAVTLEPVDFHTAMARNVIRPDEEILYSDPPDRQTPWARMDNGKLPDG